MTTMNSKKQTRTRAELARMTANLLVSLWLASTIFGLGTGEEMSQAARLAIVTSFLGLIGGALYFILCQRDDWPVITMLICMIGILSHGRDPHEDGFLIRLEMGSLGVFAYLILGLVYRINQFRKYGRMAADSPLWDPDVDRATPP
jgi:hypothetical protein